MKSNTLEYEGDNDNIAENNREIPETGNEIIMENYFNFDDEGLQKALAFEVRVVIEQEVTTNYDHGENSYDISSLLDANFNKADGEQNNE